MKKIIPLGLIIGCLFSIDANASCQFVRQCPTKEIICQKNEFMGDDGKCYSCDIDKTISVRCIGFEQLEKICSNRVRGYCQESKLKCQDSEELVGKYCRFKCEEGYTRDDTGHCCNNDHCLWNSIEH